MNAGEGEREIEEDDLTTAFYENDEIDLGHLMHEQFVLSLPMKPLCGDALQGPVSDLRHEPESRRPATAKPVWEDPRLAALAGTANEELNARTEELRTVEPENYDA